MGVGMKELCVDKGPAWLSFHWEAMPFDEWIIFHWEHMDYDYWSAPLRPHPQERKFTKFGSIHIGPFEIRYGNGESKWVRIPPNV